jgi:hypothetical protein
MKGFVHRYDESFKKRWKDVRICWFVENVSNGAGPIPLGEIGPARF